MIQQFSWNENRKTGENTLGSGNGDEEEFI